MAPKDKNTKLQKGGVIYQFKGPQINCLEEYTRETVRAFEDRLKEHLRAPSPNIPAPQDIQSAQTVSA